MINLKKYPNFNSSIEDIEKGTFVVKKYYHVGIAVDTPHGLMVPKIRNVNDKKINHISNELREISDKCKNLKIDCNWNFFWDIKKLDWNWN